jgi:magnesium transporter
MLKRLRICDGKLIESDAADGQVHLYVCPDDAEKRYLIDELKIDEHTLNSALDPDELSRVEFEPEHVAIIFKRPRNYSSADGFLFKAGSTGLFLFKDRLVIVISEDVLLFEGRQFAKVRDLQDVLLKVIYRRIFHFEEHLKVINMISEELEGEITTAMTNKNLLNLFTLEKSLVYYLNAINTNGKVIERLRANAPRMNFSPENIEFLDDVFIENNQCYEQAEIYSQVLSSMMDARATIVSNNLNVLMKTLNLIMIMLMLPTLVVSIFSMNVAFPLQTHPLAFWLILGLALAGATTVALVWWYKRL